jgi:sulfur transfer protein SufE
VWLGVIQLVAGFSTAYVNDSLTAESSAALISGFLTIVFRAVTGESLAEKGA